MANLFESAVSYFQGEDWQFTQLEGQPVLLLDVAGDNGCWRCAAHADEAANLFLFYSYCPVRARPEKRLPLALFLTRANLALPVGNFELDFEDGEVRCKTGLDVEGERLTPGLIRNAVQMNVAAMDRYLPGILAVLAGTPPVQALAEVEKALQPAAG